MMTEELTKVPLVRDLLIEDGERARSEVRWSLPKVRLQIWVYPRTAHCSAATQHLKHSLDVKSNRAALESMIAHFSNAANRRDQNIAASAIRRAVAMLRHPGVPQGVNRQLRGSHK
jgi:hypothetical protein